MMSCSQVREKWSLRNVPSVGIIKSILSYLMERKINRTIDATLAVMVFCGENLN